MSDETKAELEVALAAHVADEFPGAFLTHWIVSASAMHPERPGSTQYINSAGDDTPMHAALGLVVMLKDDILSAEEEDE